MPLYTKQSFSPWQLRPAITLPDQITAEDWRFMKASDMKKRQRFPAGDRNDQSTIHTQNEIQTWFYSLFLHT